jgi:hypothetical protein
MRILILLLFVVPLLANAQVNRSASELAKESIKTYLSTKIFKDQPYKPGDYGELKAVTTKNPNIAWLIIHKFEIEITETDADKKLLINKPYKFAFYLDKKMTVVKAEAAYLE